MRQLGVRVETVELSTDSTEAEVSTKVGFKAHLPWLGSTNSEVEGQLGKSQQKELTREFVAFDLAEAQSIGEILQAMRFEKWIVLENFHYLPLATQQELAFDLKTFHEIGVRFIVLGIWREANLLTTHNGDLQDRVVEVPVEPWSRSDFTRVAENGSQLLNVCIGCDILETFIENSFGNVGMLQEFLKTLCELYGVTETRPQLLDLSDASVGRAAIEAKLESQKGHTLKVLQGIAAKSRVRREEDDPLLLPYYLVRVILHVPIAELVNGIERSRLLELLRQEHHRQEKETVRVGDVTHLLSRLSAIQERIQPPFLYYDSNGRRLRVVDTRQFFVLANVNRTELEDEIPFPTEYIDGNDAAIDDSL